MMATFLLGALAGLWPFGSHHQTATQHFRVPAWNVQVVQDRFTGVRQCMVYQGKHGKPIVSYGHGAVAFQFPRKVNTTDAAFKIDTSPVEAWSTVYPQVVQTGAALEGRSLDNPTSGKVLLPLNLLRGAHVVVIRPAPTRWPVTFAVDGLFDVLTSASGLGCDVRTGQAS